jgi:hypothetical protein
MTDYVREFPVDKAIIFKGSYHFLPVRFVQVGEKCPPVAVLVAAKDR